MKTRSLFTFVAILLFSIVRAQEPAPQQSEWWNYNTPLIPYRLPPPARGTNVEYIDLNKDGKPEILRTKTVNDIPVQWIDDDGDMKYGDIEGDMDNDCLMIDRDKDGKYGSSGDLVIDWIDTDDDGKADMQVVADYIKKRTRGSTGPLYMWVLDLDKDNIFNYIDFNSFALRAWLHNGLADFYEDYHGRSAFLKLHKSTDRINDLRLSWENPFLFYDPDNDGLTEQAFRVLDEPLQDGTHQEQFENGIITYASLSFDLDNDNAPGNEFDLDFTLGFRGDGFNYMDQVHKFKNKRCIEADTFFMDPRLRQLTELIYPGHDAVWDLVFNRGKWNQVYFVFDEDDDCQRWERVEFYEPLNPFIIGTGKGGLDDSPRADALGDRGEWDFDNSGKGQLYVSKFDGRLHLFGADKGYWRIDQNAFSYQGFGAGHDGYIGQVTDVKFATVKYTDTDKNGFIDLIQYDLNADTLFEHNVSLIELGIDDKCDLINTSSLSYKDFVALNTTMAQNLWTNALSAGEVAKKAGLNLSWYALMMSPKSIQQKYSYGYWIQLYLYHDLMAWAYRRSDEGFLKALDLAYYKGDWESLFNRF
jgi:hypothetical protein